MFSILIFPFPFVVHYWGHEWDFRPNIGSCHLFYLLMQIHTHIHTIKWRWETAYSIFNVELYGSALPQQKQQQNNKTYYDGIYSNLPHFVHFRNECNRMERKLLWRLFIRSEFNLISNPECRYQWRNINPYLIAKKNQEYNRIPSTFCEQQ